jgi:hypothetical protein
LALDGEDARAIGVGGRQRPARRDSRLAVHVLPLVPRLAGGRRTRDPGRGIFAVPTAQRHAADGGAVREMPYGTSPERGAVIARQAAFLVLPGDGKSITRGDLSSLQCRLLKGIFPPLWVFLCLV